ncbi:hypothetical protein [Pseudomonas putida]|uniref:hypothetical protein n=1 Tax=Pseudomonas putida TaxID=303 RepID=UPI002753DBD9|nr:hypothetical protein [Pseudomonas putida]MDP9520525.1 hypothetical protein [Pseudomonas putida]
MEVREKAEASTRFVRAAYHDTMQPLASIASLAYVGERMVEQGQHERLIEIFHDIEVSGREISALFTGLREVFTSGESQPAIGSHLKLSAISGRAIMGGFGIMRMFRASGVTLDAVSCPMPH